MAPSNQRLTQTRIARAIKAGRKTWLSDDEGLRNRGRLLARVCNQRTALFYFRYSVAGKQRYVPIGPFSPQAATGFLTLEEAREAANQLSALYRDPSTREVRTALTQQARAIQQPGATQVARESPPDSSVSLGALCNLYVEQLRKDNKASWKDNKNLIGREIAPSRIASIPANEIAPDDLIEVLQPIGQRAPRQAAKLRSSLSAAYQFAVKARLSWKAPPEWKKFEIRVNPVQSISVESTAGTRDRNLNGRDLGFFWLHLTLSQKSDSIPYRFLRFNLLAGGQRCTQLLRCAIDDVDEYERALRAIDTKGKQGKARTHLLPLSDLIWYEVEELSKIAQGLGSPMLFPSSHKPGEATEPLTISKATSHIGKTLSSLALSRPIERFTYIDIRRTTESRMADLGIHKDIRAQILSHGRSGVQHTHYDRSDYMPQKREALQKWEHYLLSMADEQRQAYLDATRAK